MELVAGAIGSLIPKLKDLLKEEYKLQTGVEEQVRYLGQELESAHAALLEVAEVPPDRLDKVVKVWAREVREASYDMEDILDTFLVRIEGSSKPSDHQDSLLKRLREKMTRLFKKSKQRHEIAVAIDKIRKNLQEVTDRRGRFTVDSIVAKRAASSQTVDPRLTAMYKKSSQIIGIDNSSADLISMLSHNKGSEESNQKMKVVSVVGVGGLGKTTLAKAVYDKLKSKFDCWAFVPVGQDPSLKKVFRDILIDLDKDKYTDLKYTTLGESQLIDELRDFLRAKRYLVVIDDIWDLEYLQRIKCALDENDCGSRIIITTRNFRVAKGADEVYELKPLSYNNSKELFYTRLFDGEDKCPTNHVHELSDRILKKCGGVPLAIMTMASFLLGKNRAIWIEVCNSRGFYQDKEDRDMENTRYILSLSYNDLPCHLKTCLLYLSIFPEDYLIHKDCLIWMWIAEGFVEKKPGRGSFEVGEEYFHELINRSLIQGVESEATLIMDGCRVHDMVLDLIISMSSEQNFVSADGTLSQCHTRRFALRNGELDLTQDTHVNLPQVRSFVALQCAIDKWALHPRLKLIRVLALENCIFTEGTHSLEHIGNLLHLRYLGIRDSWFIKLLEGFTKVPEGIGQKLPEGIGELKFLQTLTLETFRYLELPCSIGKLKQLVCLRAQGLRSPDGAIGRLTSLEELQIGEPRDNDESRRQFVKDLGNLSELRVLNIKVGSGIMMDEALQIALVNSLGSPQKMQYLTLRDSIYNVHMNAWDAAVLSRDLRCLFLPNICFYRLPSWINSVQLPSLSHLDVMVGDLDEKGLKALAELPELCYLRLYTGVAITCNIESDGCFQKLRSLVLRNSIVQFVANKKSLVGTATGRRTEKDDCSRVIPAVVMLPKLEELEFTVDEEILIRRENVIRCHNLGLEYFPSLQRMKVRFDCRFAFEDDVEREEAALRHAIEVHPNRPALEIKWWGKDLMKRRSDNDGSVQLLNEEDEEENQ